MAKLRYVKSLEQVKQGRGGARPNFIESTIRSVRMRL